ncbi:hypothetical protein [Saccharopolyspora phatthalungensis]|uniref:Holliday junction resolvasome RuvABC ATP-dependent DNA helicase subunit n=1 Tax=Saccharopolyspora phatthalungensis TaxID=664693 RepID=A0A840QGA3_9PSEU|nr:hypothetical protein [Saccharopolyspora phatthalungensis]MBB5157639.1 Holliday junction resolvasome RuvABC ATP-dependent DNA helicase subunit [Saccharopolyspora phatthalungensis]
MDGVVKNSLGPGLADSNARRLIQIANHPWVRDEVRAEQQARTRRTAANLALLRAPLDGVDLDSRDHATLTWLADHDADIVAGVQSLLNRARAAEPRRESGP